MFIPESERCRRARMKQRTRNREAKQQRQADRIAAVIASGRASRRTLIAKVREELEELRAMAPADAPELKADARIVAGYANTFGNADSQGDIVAPGAFDQWLSDFHSMKNPLPLLVAHPRPFSGADAVGWATVAKVDRYGLFTEFELLPDHADCVVRAVKSREWDGLSIGYAVKESRKPTPAERELGARRVLTRIDVGEVSLVRVPANTGSRVLAAKSAGEMLVDRIRAGLAANREKQADTLPAAERWKLAAQMREVRTDARLAEAKNDAALTAALLRYVDTDQLEGVLDFVASAQ